MAHPQTSQEGEYVVEQDKDIPEGPGVPEWATVTRQQKNRWVTCYPQQPDMPPMVVVERDGAVVVTVICPQVDKIMGLQAASICKAFMDPDSMVLTFDAHTSSLSPEAWKAKYGDRNMQDVCDDENACAISPEDITDTMICTRVLRTGRPVMTAMPYTYHSHAEGEKTGKGAEGESFVWHDAKFYAAHDLQGFISDKLMEIMTIPPVLEDPIIASFGEARGLSPERQIFHTIRAGVIALAQRGFFIMDMITPKHPEWTDHAENPYPSFVRTQRFGPGWEDQSQAVSDELVRPRRSGGYIRGRRRKR